MEYADDERFDMCKNSLSRIVLQNTQKETKAMCQSVSPLAMNKKR